MVQDDAELEFRDLEFRAVRCWSLGILEFRVRGLGFAGCQGELKV